MPEWLQQGHSWAEHKHSIKKKSFSPKEFFKGIATSLKQAGKDLVPKELDYNAGLEVRIQNPDELLNNKGSNLRLYDTMLLDDVIFGTIELKKRILLSVPWSIVPASEDEADQEKAEFIEENIERLTVPFNNQLDNFLDAWIYGFKVAEKIWEAIDGKWMWKNIKHKPSLFFDFKYDESGDLDTLLIGYYYGEDIKVVGAENINHKFIIYVNPYQVDGNWYGESDLMGIYTQYHQKYYTYRWRGSYLQGFGMPVPLVAYEKGNVSTTEYNDFTEMLDNWQDTMYVMIPSVRDPKTGELKKKFEVDFRELSSKTEKTPYDNVIEQLNTDMRRKLLIPDKMGFSDSDGGSYSLGETQFDILKMIIRDGHTKLEEVINPHIRELIDLNFPNVDEYPKFEFNELSEKIEVQMLQMLIDKKVISAKESWIRGRLQLPEITDTEQAEIDEAEDADFEKTIKRQQEMGFGESENPADKGNSGKDKEKPTFNKVEFKTKRQKANDIKKTLDDDEEWFLDSYTEIYNEQSDNLLAQVKKKGLIEDKDLKDVSTLRIKKNKLKDLLTTYYFKLYIAGKLSGIMDIKEKVKNLPIEFKDRVEIPDEWLSRSFIRDILAKEGALGKLTPDDISYLNQLQDQAFFITGDIEGRMVKNVYLAITEGLASGDTIATITSRIRSNLTSDLQKYGTTIARTNASDAFNTGRLNFFESQQVNKFIQAYQYSAIIDDATTEFCRSHDEQIIKANDPRVATVNPPNHFNCRSVLLPIMVGENEIQGSEFYRYETQLTNTDSKNKVRPWGTGVPAKESLPAKGFGGV